VKRRLGRPSLLAAVTCFGLALTACDDKSKDSKAEEPKTAAVPETKPEGDAKSPHGDAKAPHPPMGAPPHAMGAQAKEPGPPRDVDPSGETTDAELAELTVPVPKEWEKETPSSSMRLAQWTIPGPGGDAELVVFRFPGGAGGVQANVDRWKGQFQPPEGKTIDDVTTVEEMKAGDLEVTLVDVQGRYVAAMQPGAEAKHDAPDYRMLAAIIQGSGDPFFLKATGPAKTLEVWREPYEAMLKAIKKA